jgi:hypothetical protein
LCTVAGMTRLFLPECSQTGKEGLRLIQGFDGQRFWPANRCGA